MASNAGIAPFLSNPFDGGASSTSDTAALYRQRLASAQLYLCTDSRKGKGDFADFVDAAYRGGVDIIQLRDKNIEAAEELACLDVLRAAAQRHGKLFSANDRADIALLSGAHVLHVGQDDVSLPAARHLMGPHPVIGLSTHTPAQVDAAMTIDELDYFCAGPVWATPTKPGRAAAGLELVQYAAARTTETGSQRAWFAIGGIDHTTIGHVIEAGARRVVVVRAITEANDPCSAAESLKSALPPLS
ncbi:thiamine phosphate synthase [Arthrobacter cheniae]|uniref:Thiamine-phosphate synthase n=1 Tax=Arthrobacter cheniae TaxID=1258888 RepID=A0A3A5MEL5_9MICC|nr:thiamine phosphate synthase [Arthrobacter cheniae]RJT82898.1 thiamine phosphate synthase [Arthrobacter cheniae]